MPYNKSEQGATAPMKRRPMRRRKKVCVFCADKNNIIDYKDLFAGRLKGICFISCNADLFLLPVGKNTHGLSV